MRYQRSLDIEHRLQTVLRLISSGGFSTPRIAEELGVSIPTISRDIIALRERGYDIRSRRNRGAWRYDLTSSTAPPNTLPTASIGLTHARH